MNEIYAIDAKYTSHAVATNLMSLNLQYCLSLCFFPHHFRQSVSRNRVGFPRHIRLSRETGLISSSHSSVASTSITAPVCSQVLRVINLIKLCVPSRQPDDAAGRIIIGS